MNVEGVDGEILGELVVSDTTIRKRFDDILSGVERNGHAPSVFMEAALTDDTDAQVAFLAEYRWALALLVQQEQIASQERKDVLTLVAEDTLFIAAETYDPKKEPNFLKHLGVSFLEYLRSEGWNVNGYIITPDRFDTAIRSAAASQEASHVKDEASGVIPSDEADRVLEAVSKYFDIPVELLVNGRVARVADARRTAIYFMAERYRIDWRDIRAALSLRLDNQYAESALARYQQELETDQCLQNIVAGVSVLLELRERRRRTETSSLPPVAPLE